MAKTFPGKAPCVSQFAEGSDSPFIFYPLPYWVSLPFWVSPLKHFLRPPLFNKKNLTQSIKPYKLNKPLGKCLHSLKEFWSLFLVFPLRKSWYNPFNFRLLMVYWVSCLKKWVSLERDPTPPLFLIHPFWVSPLKTKISDRLLSPFSRWLIPHPLWCSVF